MSHPRVHVRVRCRPDDAPPYDRRRRHGQALVEFALLTPLLVLLLFAAVDTARLMGAKQRQDQQTLEVARFLAWHPDAGVGDAVAVIGLDDSCVTEADIDVDAVTVGTRCEFRPELFRDWIGLPLSSTATAAAMPSPEPAPAPSASPEPSGGAS